MERNLLIAGTFALLLGAVPAHGQGMDMGNNLDPRSRIELPPICKAEVAAGAMTMTMGQQAEALDEGHQALMDSMSEMHKTMDSAMAADDVDVAFICGMIPHHQGAVAMARAELAYGDDPWAKALAEQIIAAQEKEIADMLDWLEQQSRKQ